MKFEAGAFSYYGVMAISPPPVSGKRPPRRGQSPPPVLELLLGRGGAGGGCPQSGGNWRLWPGSSWGPFGGDRQGPSTRGHACPTTLCSAPCPQTLRDRTWGSTTRGSAPWSPTGTLPGAAVLTPCPRPRRDPLPVPRQQPEPLGLPELPRALRLRLVPRGRQQQPAQRRRPVRGRLQRARPHRPPVRQGEAAQGRGAAGTSWGTQSSTPILFHSPRRSRGRSTRTASPPPAWTVVPSPRTAAPPNPTRRRNRSPPMRPPAC